MKNIIKLGVFLFIVSAIAAAALSLTYMVTAPKIEEQRQAAISQALRSSCLSTATNIKEKDDHYIGYDNNVVCGYAFRVLPKGYGGEIDMLVGIDPNGRVSGINILGMSETPGLGTQINTPEFLGQFLNKTRSAKLKAKQDIDAISGATISSQAICDGVKKAFVRFDNK